VLPAFSAHRVWVGHWFLTPDFFEREAQLRRLLNDPRLEPQLEHLLEQQEIRYLVTHAARASALARRLGDRVARRRRVGGLELLILEQPAARQGT
jgi:predicted membrane chloride channel (bestrophin family)